MKILMLLALSLALLASYAEAKKVLAHFMVGNTAHYDQALWEDEMRLAAGSGIDAFALNIANGEKHNDVQLDLAFKAAAARNFKLIFSFDYAGGEFPWTKETVLGLLRTYATKGTYLPHNGLPLVSTFEGPDFADDWNWIKSSFKVFFVPDWSSKGAKIAVGLGNGVADGLFNWAAWPDQPNWPKETYIDASYAVALKGKPYMMPVSPWFYTNMPGFDKNWMWRGEMLWYDRWVQTLHVQPEWVQIISWNDYGESHYIAPIRGEKSLVAFGDTYGKSPFNYARGIEHGAWRIFLPHMISLYKTGTAAVTQEGLNIWYRMHPKSAGCKDSGTTAYTATHMQVERPWTEGNRDGVFFAAMLGSAASAHVTIGGTVFNPTWRYFPEGGVGIYVGWVETQATGTVKVEIKRGANVVVSLTGERPIGGCQDGFFNFNPVVYATLGPTIASKSPPVVINKDTPCVAGNGIGDFQDLCQNACKFNYCPLEACMCTKWGKQQGTDIVRGPPGYPAAGRDTNFEGLCAVTCSYGSAGICPSGKCGMVKLPPIVSSVSPFTAKSCTSGHALPTVPGDQAARDKICAFGCKYGYCPTEICVCDSVGVLVLPQNVGVQYTGDKPGFKSSLVGIRLLCKYTCGWGVCPAPVCKLPGQVPAPVCIKGTGKGNFEGLCDFSCHFGFCPEPCTCLEKGDQVPAPADNGKSGYPAPGVGWEYGELCRYACSHGYCPSGAFTSCAVGGDEEKSLTERWKSVDGDNAIFDLAVIWGIRVRAIQERGGDYLAEMNNFIYMVSESFAGKKTNGEPFAGKAYSCHILGSARCDVPLTCQQSNYPAVGLVMQSFGNMHGFHNSMYTAVTDAATAISERAKSISDACIKKATSPLEALLKILGVIDLITTVAGAGIWSKIFKASFAARWSKSVEVAETFKDSATAAIETYGALSGASTEFETAAENAKNLGEFATALVSHFHTTISKTLTSYFTFIDEIGAAPLRRAINGGVFLENPITAAGISRDDMKNSFLETFSAQLVLTAWASGDKQWPVVVFVEKITEETPEEAAGTEDGFMFGPDAPTARIHHNGHTLWLVEGRTSGVLAEVVPASLLKGTEELIKDNNPLGVTLKQLAVSAYEGWRRNGQKNPFPMSSTTSGAAGSSDFMPFEQGVMTPGFINIPVCTVQDVIDNWQYFARGEPKIPRCNYYPCCNIPK
ncbi:glycosyl hydrolase family 71-domain-containing protein [Plectosphaerella plurivora]|uniref:Glycosyl hydrolase family 71-domain-containing protein n=1 Tax=Plectosphaerella plurivora TaxID=936078 RepID=A0A9P9A5Y8_9PEZI|nr:glycosyl hydrolase family 71-domain-containing protein [Plectosphaerella plurivora]